MIGRDAEIKTILDRINYLKDISEENDREVTNSIERIKPHIDDNNFECSSNNISMRRTYSFEGSEIRNDDMNSNYRYEPKIDNLNEKENVLNISQSRNLKKKMKLIFLLRISLMNKILVGILILIWKEIINLFFKLTIQEVI